MNLNHLHMQSHGQTSAQVTPWSFSTTKNMAIFSGSGKRMSITMTTAWICAPCQRMRQIQITQWSGTRACNLLAKIEFRCGWLRWREWCVAWALRGRSCGRYASTRESDSIHKLSLQSKFLPSFRKRYSPPNPESASIGRNLGWRNSLLILSLESKLDENYDLLLSKLFWWHWTVWYKTKFGSQKLATKFW